MQNLGQFNQKNTLDKLEIIMQFMNIFYTIKEERIHEILSDKYCKSNLEQLTQECRQLTKKKKQKLLTLFLR